MARDHFMIELEFIDTDAARASDAVLGAWCRIQAYAVPRLLSGRIPSVRPLDDASSMRLLHVTRTTIDEIVAAGLARWEGDDLVLHGFDHDGQRIWMAKSGGGVKGGKASGERRRATGNSRTPSKTDRSSACATPSTTDRRSPSSTPSDSDARSGGTDESDRRSPSRSPRTPSPSPSPVLPVHEYTTAAAPRAHAREPDEAWASDPRLAAAAALGARITDDEGKDLTDRWRNALGKRTPDEIRRIFAAAPELLEHEARYPGAFMTAARLLAQQDAETTADANELELAAARQERRQANAQAHQAITAWLKTDAAIPVRSRLASGALRDLLAVLSESDEPGYLPELLRSVPELEPVVRASLRVVDAEAS